MMSSINKFSPKTIFSVNCLLNAEVNEVIDSQSSKISRLQHRHNHHHLTTATTTMLDVHILLFLYMVVKRVNTKNNPNFPSPLFKMDTSNKQKIVLFFLSFPSGWAPSFPWIFGTEAPNAELRPQVLKTVDCGPQSPRPELIFKISTNISFLNFILWLHSNSNFTLSNKTQLNSIIQTRVGNINFKNAEPCGYRS